EIVARLQVSEEAPLVRMAALEALCAIEGRARAAIEKAAEDSAPAVRRCAAALAAAEGFDDLHAHFAADLDASVRASPARARGARPRRAARATRPPPAAGQPSPRRGRT